jgi:tetratricopeptide (TPR) repeat protein
MTAESLLLKLPFFLTSILFGLIALKSQQTSMSYEFAPHFPLISRIFIASYGITHYVLSFIYPFKQSPLHPYPVQDDDALPWYFFGSMLTIFLMIFCMVYFRKYRKIFVFTLGFFIINLMLVIQLLPVGKAIVAERYTYLAYPGLSMLMGYFLFGFSGKFKKILLAAVAIWLIFLSVKTYARLPVWENSLAVFSDIITTHPKEESGWYNRGLVRFYMKDYKAALEDYNASLALKADNAPALYNRSLVKKEFQDYQGVLDDLNKAIALEPGYIDARKNRGIANAIFKDYQGAMNDFSVVLKQFPDDTSTLINRGLIWVTLDKKEKACADFTKAARLGSSRASKFASETCIQNLLK